VIKTTSLALLMLRIMRYNRRTCATAWLAQVFSWSRTQTERTRNQWQSRRQRLPDLLVSFRVALGPVMVVLSLISTRGLVMAGCIGLALLSDVFDGFLARLWNLATVRLRRRDTRADTFFYACVLAVILLHYPHVLASRRLLLAGLVTAEVIQHVFAAAKYGRHASYHSWISRMWGVMMAVSMIGLLGFGMNNWLLDLTIAWGILCNLQGLAMSLLLEEWHNDVPTLLHAWKLRQGCCANQG
jgi:CDP-diacylglycerol--glycerol-3-phosphate 3-phosphatidyltransferase